MPSAALPDLLGFLAASPSPFHAVHESAGRLAAAGFSPVPASGAWETVPARGYVVRDGNLIAWSTPAGSGPAAPFRLVGAHTDSPNLRVTPSPDVSNAGLRQLGIEVYGGALRNSWLDRDLGVSGRLTVRGAAGPEQRLFLIDRPVLTVPQLAIHLDRRVSDEGLVLNPHVHLRPVWAGGDRSQRTFAELLASEVGIAAHEILGWQAMLHDLCPPALLGSSEELLASGRIDNLVSCWAGTQAIIEAAARHGDEGSPASTSAGPVSPARTSSSDPASAQLSSTSSPSAVSPSRSTGATAAASPSIPSSSAGNPPVAVLALFDHEEVGSVSATGAGGAWLEQVLERLVIARGGGRRELLAALAGSMCASADGAHATHPNYLERHDLAHPVVLNGGPAVKFNANQRYATDDHTAAALVAACERAGVPVQRFVNRADLPCGSTIGPITSARLAIATADIGVPQLAMHSARELCGSDDPPRLARALTEFLAP